MIKEIKIGEVYVRFHPYRIEVVKVINITRTTVLFRTRYGEGLCYLEEFKEDFFTPDQFKCLVDKEVVKFIKKNKQR